MIERSVFDLAFLTPGVYQNAGNGTKSSGSPNNFISNGGRGATADILIDGVTTTNIEQEGGIQIALYEPSIDAVQEFKVQQSRTDKNEMMSLVPVTTPDRIRKTGGSFPRNSVRCPDVTSHTASSTAPTCTSPAQARRFASWVEAPCSIMTHCAERGYAPSIMAVQDLIVNAPSKSARKLACVQGGQAVPK